MVGVTDLKRLLSSMDPVLQDGEVVYCTVPDTGLQQLSQFRPLAMFRESEGVTLILAIDDARAAGLSLAVPMRRITLNVHSSLEAVGLTAAVAAALTEEGISANVVAAYYHDHIFVPSSDAERAVAALRALAVST